MHIPLPILILLLTSLLGQNTHCLWQPKQWTPLAHAFWLAITSAVSLAGQSSPHRWVLSFESLVLKHVSTHFTAIPTTARWSAAYLGNTRVSTYLLLCLLCSLLLISPIGALLDVYYTTIATLLLLTIFAFSLLSALSFSPEVYQLPPPRLFELRPAFYWCLLPINLISQWLWLPLIIATCDFLFQIDRFPRSPCLATRIVKITFLFRSRSLLSILVVSFSRLLRLAIVWFPCFLSSPFL